MNDDPNFFNQLANSAGVMPVYSLESMALSLLLAFVIGQYLAWVYMKIHSGLSYSRTFTQSIVLLTMVVALVMFVIGNSIVTAFGLIGALAIIRFRNVLKDTRDTTFVFFALVLGMAVGSQRYLAAITGTLALSAVAYYLHITRFGSMMLFDGHLDCRLSGEQRQSAFTQVTQTLRRHCNSFKKISVREGGDGAQYVFQVRLRDPLRSAELVTEIEGIAASSHVGLVIRDEFTEL
jgi:hypothetical protein